MPRAYFMPSICDASKCILKLFVGELSRWHCLELDLRIWLLQSCHLHEVADTFGSLSAQKRNESKMHTGFAFLDCKIDGTGIVYLGRAWGNFSRTVFSYTYMSDIIYGPGWSDFGFPDRQQWVPSSWILLQFSVDAALHFADHCAHAIFIFISKT